jgi:hypothetical protein
LLVCEESLYIPIYRHDASFTVISNRFTLLNDFNASLYADVEGVDTLLKEYVINVGED